MFYTLLVLAFVFQGLCTVGVLAFLLVWREWKTWPEIQKLINKAKSATFKEYTANVARVRESGKPPASEELERYISPGGIG